VGWKDGFLQQEKRFECSNLFLYCWLPNTTLTNLLIMNFCNLSRSVTFSKHEALI